MPGDADGEERSHPRKGSLRSLLERVGLLPAAPEGNRYHAFISYRHAADARPRQLEGAFDEEPRHIDLRWARTADDLSLTHPRFREAVAELAAPLHGKPKDEIASEEVRQHRRTVWIARGAVTTLLTLTALAVVAG